ncbi:glutathione S-transferase C-terminal domain-containing protein [Massilia sp. IC2-476]|uniref:glutathione S-transferase C-terminal domain-containing protein n=1 Tax=Massilia sp. IC2-476 TaxID=2887199 RepID=UPI001D12CB1F|nr:glutathione S-transferase C-terminal domain-containing protein [Massilia sp. IC2-476]MCC2974838.1 glutathione S-transferase N-terminal domain-containing protein [Massilia sp. IC2-476]
MKLIGSVTSPYVRKVRVVMADKKLDFSFEQENVWVPETTIQQVNPLGKIPCLVMEDGSTLYDSRVIAEYLDTISPVCKLLPPNGRDRTEVKVWEALADGVLDAAILVFIERRDRAPEQQSAKWIERQMGKVHAGLREMSSRLGDSAYCMGIHYTLADVAVGCTLGWLSFRFPDIDWRGDYPNLARLADKLAERPSFRDTVPFTA